MDGQLSIFDYISSQMENSQQNRADFEEQCIIEQVKRGSGFAEGKKRIYEMFNSNQDKSERIAFLKKEYGVGGWHKGHSEKDGLLGADCSANGMRVDYWYHNDGYCVMLGWKHVEEYIDKLIETGDYYKENECKINKDAQCNRKNLTWLARDLGMKCEAKCCAGCIEKYECGVACNNSKVNANGMQ